MNAPDAPRLSWTSANAASVTVSGPGVARTEPSGSVVVCPSTIGGSANGAVCTTPVPGTYTYTLALRDEAGEVVFSAEAQLVVGP